MCVSAYVCIRYGCKLLNVSNSYKLLNVNDSYLCIWSYWMLFFCLFLRLTTLLDHPRTIEYLAYLGYHYYFDNQLSAIQGNKYNIFIVLFV